MSKNKIYFNLNDNDICAGGTVLYRIIKNKGELQTDVENIELLLVKNRGAYEDLGGKIDENDSNIYETVAREMKEESNDLIDYNSILERIKIKVPIYVKRSKYAIFLIEANNSEKELTSTMFGTREIHDNINRTVHWISLSDFYKFARQKEVNFRLMNKSFFDALHNLEVEQGTQSTYNNQHYMNIEDESKNESITKKNTTYMF